MTTERPDDEEALSVISAERAKAFVDAVVAIALTLLILPLIDSVTSDPEGVRAGTWFAHHVWPLVSFVLSFAIIAMFWMNHHRLFSRVARVSTPLLWINIAWLLTIVWLPVATALIGSEQVEPIATVSYVGTMIVTSALTLTMRLYLRTHPELHDAPERALRVGASVDLAMISLFALALILILAIPSLNYFPMFLMLLTGPAQALWARVLHVGPSDARAGRVARPE